MGEQATTTVAASEGAQVVFDLSRLREPRALLEYARKHLAIIRDEEVTAVFRTEAAETANRIAGRAGDALVLIKDDKSMPLAVRWLAYHLLDDVNVILRESYARLHPSQPAAPAALVLFLPGRRADYERALALLDEAEKGREAAEQGNRLAALRAHQQATLAGALLRSVAGPISEPPRDELARDAYNANRSGWTLHRLRVLIRRLRPAGLVPGEFTRYGHPRNLRPALQVAPAGLRGARAANDTRPV